MNRIFWTAGLSAALGFAACGETTPSEVDPLDLGYDGTGIGVTIAPLDLPGVTDACYSFDIRAGATAGVAGTGQRVVARGSATGTAAAGQGGDGGPGLDPATDGAIANPLCSNRFGNSQGAISYVAPCDASEGNQTHNITLWVNAVCQAGTGVNCTGLNGFVNPCGSAGCTVTAQCVENADVPVEFNFTIMASAQQGFFDIAVNFDNVFCSAKLDSCYGDGEWPDDAINLLFDADPDSDTFGQRAHTAVAALACTAGPGGTTFLNFTNLSVTCGGTEYVLDLSDVTQEGNLVAPGNATLSSAIGNLTAAIYYGAEALPNAGGPAGSASKVYTNIAFLIPDGQTCEVNWYIVPSSTATPPQPADGNNGTFTQVAGVRFDGATVRSGSCDQHPLNDPDGPVTTDYYDGLPPNTPMVPYTGQLPGPNPEFVPVTVPVAPECTPNGMAFSLECHALIDGDAICPAGFCTYACSEVGAGQCTNPPLNMACDVGLGYCVP